MELKPVKSSNIAALGHDASSLDLHIQFSDGARYVYEGVPAETHAEMLKSKSVGGFFAKSIRQQFKGRRLPVGE